MVNTETTEEFVKELDLTEEEIESYTYDNYGNRERGVLFCDGA